MIPEPPCGYQRIFVLVATLNVAEVHNSIKSGQNCWQKIRRNHFTTVYIVLTYCPFIEGHIYYTGHNDERYRLCHVTGPTVADCCQETNYYLRQVWSRSMSRNGVTMPKRVITVHVRVRVRVCVTERISLPCLSHRAIQVARLRFVGRHLCGTWSNEIIVVFFIFDIHDINILLKEYRHTSMKKCSNSW